MPLFEYRCSACQHLEEVLQKHDEPAPEVCPKCGKTQTLAKELSLTSFQLKGGGWYKDLYSSTKPGSSSSSDASSSTSSSSSSSSTSSSSGSGSSGSGSSGSSGGGSSGPASGGSSGGGGSSAAAA